jgi:hypothetical protein
MDHLKTNISYFYASLFFLLDLTRIMAQSKDANELAHMWQQWHEETGRPLRSKFVRYVELSNDAARLNGKTTATFICNESHHHLPQYSNLRVLSPLGAENICSFIPFFG